MKKILSAISLGAIIGLGLMNPSVAFAKKGFGKEDIDKFCADTSKAKPGMQFDGKKASKAILNLKPGKYSYANNGMLLLFANNHYLLLLTKDRDGIHGTDGDDLLASGGIVGGCSKEQLSEAVQNNKTPIKTLKLLKPYTK